MSSDLTVWMLTSPPTQGSSWVRVHRFDDELLPPSELPAVVEDECRNLPPGERARILDAAYRYGVAHVTVRFGANAAERREGFSAALDLARSTNGYLVATSDGWEPLEQMRAYKAEEIAYSARSSTSAT